MKKAKRTVILSLLFLLLIVSFKQTAAAAKKMSVYNEVIKHKNTVYCTDTAAIYKVNLKTQKVKKLDKVKGANSSGIQQLKKKGSYLYYYVYKIFSYDLCRINLSTGKKKVILKLRPGKQRYRYLHDYVISGSRIYYKVGYRSFNDDKKDKFVNRVMKLNGKGKKKTSVKAKTIIKNTNAKGYSCFFRIGSNEDYCYSYLKTPKKTIYLGFFTW